MKRRTSRYGVTALVVLGAVFASSGLRAQGHCPWAGRDGGSAGGTLAALDDRTRAAIEEALRDELRSEAQYSKAIENGARMPFMRIVRAEQRHADFLRALFRDRQLPVPQDTPVADDNVATGSLATACAMGVASEARNIALYDRLLAAGPLPRDVKAVFEHNRWASRAHHTPALQRCAGVASDDVAPGGGAADGRRHGRRGHGGCGHHAGPAAVVPD